MFTVATVCDNITECVGAQDESSFCDDSNNFSYYFIFLPSSLVILIFTILELYDLYTDDDQQTEEIREDQEICLDEFAFKKFHESDGFSPSLNIFLMKVKSFKSTKERKNICLDYMEFEMNSHGNDISKEGFFSSI